jgi:hypothetical protein
MTALMLAAKLGSDDCVKCLLKAGADVNMTNKVTIDQYLCCVVLWCVVLLGFVTEILCLMVRMDGQH